jgi:hypothetical protein
MTTGGCYNANSELQLKSGDWRNEKQEEYYYYYYYYLTSTLAPPPCSLYLEELTNIRWEFNDTGAAEVEKIFRILQENLKLMSEL